MKKFNLDAQQFRKILNILGVVLLISFALFLLVNNRIQSTKEGPKYLITYDPSTQTYRVDPKTSLSAQDLIDINNDLKKASGSDDLSKVNVDFDPAGALIGKPQDTINYFNQEADKVKSVDDDIKQKLLDIQPPTDVGDTDPANVPTSTP